MLKLYYIIFEFIIDSYMHIKNDEIDYNIVESISFTTCETYYIFSNLKTMINRFI